MKNLLHYFILLVAIIIAPFKFEAQISENTQISLLTCAEGEEIYSLFGHSAIRIKDSYNNIDVCYNWGMFEFDEDEIEFATKFTKGRLKYYMAEQEFQYFLFEYDYTNRTVKEQVLNLSFSQKKAIWDAIQKNYLPENRVYKYDFFFDNCSSRIRDIFMNSLKDDLVIVDHKNVNEFTLRELLNNSIDHMPWLSFGMDLALGSKVDIKANNSNMMFLPKYMNEIFANSNVVIDGNLEPFVLQENLIIKGVDHKQDISFFTSPNTVFWFIFILLIALGVVKVKFLTKFLDGLVLLILGLLGVTILFLWFGTDHETMHPNYNVLWANPLHLFFIAPLLSNKLHFRLNKAYLIMAIILFVIIIGAMVIPQEFNSATTPIILLLAFKYFYWYKETKKAA